jgi:two-component system, OmpR family, response regulator
MTSNLRATTTTQANKEILLVEDNKTAREELVRWLTGRGFRVRQAGTYQEAIREAASGTPGVVLLDNVLGDKMDGMDAAQRIQHSRPETAFIFVSGSAHAVLQRRAREVGLRIGGWIEKPLDPEKLDQLVRLLDKESQKSQLLARAADARDTDSYRQGLAAGLAAARSLPREVVEEVEQELQDPGLWNSKPEPSLHNESDPKMIQVEGEIDALYDQIRKLVEQRQGDPGLKEALRPLRERLRALQEIEADEMERHYRAQLLFDPAEGRRLLNDARRLLKKK